MKDGPPPISVSAPVSSGDAGAAPPPGPSAPATDAAPPRPRTGPTEEEKTRGHAIADAFLSYLRWCNRELARFPGAFQLPDMVLDGLVAPCARELAAKYAGDVEMTDTVRGIVVLGGAACTVGQLEYRKLQKRREEEANVIPLVPFSDLSDPPAPHAPPPRPPEPTRSEPTRQTFGLALARARKTGPSDDRFTKGPGAGIS